MYTANYLPTPAIGFTYVHVSGHSFPALYMEIPTGLLVSPIHSADIHHDKCSSLIKLLPTTPAGYTNVHVSSHRLPISVCSVEVSMTYKRNELESKF